MTRRAWWLVVLNFLIPGSAQVLAGNRKLGRIGLGATLGMWAFAVIAFVVFLLWRSAIYSFVTGALSLLVIQVLLAAYAVLWVVLTIDTFRLVRLVKIVPSARLWIAAATAVLLAASAGTAGAGAYYAGITRGTLGSIFGSSAAVAPADGRYNILLLGGDAGEDREGLRPDSISVVSIDAATGRATMIGLPRDMLYVPFSEGSPFAEAYPDGYRKCDVSACKLNSIYTEAQVMHPDWYPDAKANGSLPGIEATKDAVEGVTGLQIQFYVLIDMHGFADLVDALGGVEIDVKQRLPIGGDENLKGVTGWIEPGKRVLNGYNAEWYARSRHSTSDWDRMRRQRELQEAILKQFTPANVLTKFQGIAQAGTRVMKTDIPQSMLGYFTELALKTKELPVTSIELVPPKVDPDDPDFGYIRDLITKDLYPTTSPTPSGG